MKYKKYNAGGWASAQARDTALGIGGVSTQLLDVAAQPKDRFGRVSVAGNTASKAANMGMMGAKVAGPWGAAAGAVIGGVTGLIGAKNANDTANRLEAAENWQLTQQRQAEAQARVAADPSLVRGNLAASYYANGGHLNAFKQATVGGKADNLSSTAVEFNGPSHEQGGIKIPGMQAEVEGQETSNGSYVFSSRLGFAQRHKPLAKTMGKIETKTISPERINTLKLLKREENNLINQQEEVKAFLGLN